MYIEDLIKILSQIGGTNRFDKPVVESLNLQTNIIGSGFTEKQSQLAVKIIKRYINKINQTARMDLTQFVDSPTYKLPIRSSALTQCRVSIINHPVWNKAIKVEFPYDDALVTFIREKKASLGEFNFAIWDKDQKAWIFTLSEATIKVVSDLIDKKPFILDDEFQDYLTQYTNIVLTMEKFMPMLVIEDNIPQFKNLPPQVPQLTTTEWLKSVFEARKIGVDIWDDTIEQFLQSDNVEKIVHDFLKTGPSDYFRVDSGKNDISCLKNIVQFLEPGIFIIPGGVEFEKTVESYNFLKSIGVNNEEISVLFRLSNQTDKNFNDFIKSNKLNNPISEKTRYIFISTKLPKTVLDSYLNFYSVISYSEYFTHHSLREYSKKCQNFIYFYEQRTDKGINFANL